MTYPACLLINKKTQRFHPILFRLAPLPGQDPTEESVMRHKSLGHHTEGFDTEEAALNYINDQPTYRWMGLVYEWDGEATPAMVEWFNIRGEG